MLPFEREAFLAVGIELRVPWKNPHLQSAAARLALFGNHRSLAPTIKNQASMKTLKNCWWMGLSIAVGTVAGCGPEAESTTSAGIGTNRPFEAAGADRTSEGTSINRTPESADANQASEAVSSNLTIEAGAASRSSQITDPNQSSANTDGSSTLAMSSAAKAMAALAPTEGNQARGTVTFTSADKGVRVVAIISGLAPGEHGFHIHEKGDCSAADASSAGEHFNPTGAPHGGPDSDQHHIGDLGNITADSSGSATLDRVFSYLTLEGDTSIIGRAVVVHSGRDDLTSQPGGDAGTRVACGVIQ
jgi:Cu-Zn family superoxide dismutase